MAHVARRQGASSSSLHEDEHGGADGFAAYELTGEWSGGLSGSRKLSVFDIQATNPTARAALWQYLVGVDLVGALTAHMLPIDEPLRHLLRDPRRARIDYVNDGMWLAPLDPRPCSKRAATPSSTGTS